MPRRRREGKMWKMLESKFPHGEAFYHCLIACVCGRFAFVIAIAIPLVLVLVITIAIAIAVNKE